MKSYILIPSSKFYTQKNKIFLLITQWECKIVIKGDYYPEYNIWIGKKKQCYSPKKTLLLTILALLNPLI